MNPGRTIIADALVADLVGPLRGVDELLERKPSEQYLAGAIYPIGFRGNDTQQEDQLDPMQQTTKFFPSANGLSVLARPDTKINVKAEFASYSNTGGGSWKRCSHQVVGLVDVRSETGTLGSSFQFENAPHASISVTVRAIANSDRVLITAMLTNRHVAGSKSEDGNILFQTGITISASEALEPLTENEYDELAGSESIHLGEEEEDLAFLYRNSEPLAHGHGVSVDWSDDRKRVWTITVPQSLVHGLRADPQHLAGIDLSIEKLKGPHKGVGISQLVGSYATWVNTLTERMHAVKLGGRHGAAAQRISDRQLDCLARIEAGAARLQNDPKMSAAWDFALESMAAQFQRPAVRGSLKSGAPQLRPFQVAYALLILPGLGTVGAADASREVVDLLWFPTGGGKTEAYLLVVLIEAFLRRLENPLDSGCVALSRYTYRMLAFDQFARATSAICAAEIVRRSAADQLGSAPFSAGLWIGSSQTPNRLAEIETAYGDNLPWRQRWIKNQPSFPILNCPWCGVTLRFSSDYLISDPDNFNFALWCTNNSGCPFGDQAGAGLPISVIDEHIYRSLPTIVVATADKMAQLPVWSSQEGPALLRGRGPAGPVSLLVFDELHLLSGPLGTLTSLYEIAVDAVISSAGARRPKVLASTATIRTASNQAKALLGRQLSTFPASGDSPDDSFWAVRDNRPETARLYLGAMTSGSTWQALYVYAQTSIFRSVFSLPAEQRNPYWTSIVYAGTLRDHGRAVGLIANDVRSRISQFNDIEPREIREIEELRGDRIGSRLPQVLAALKRDYTEVDNDALDAVVTTNLIQVGVDVPRLGLMIMLGQPKGTAEYIQASSRVGRTAESSGLVFTLFQHTRPRDRSHYELFKSYHEALYRSVEPISVTPLAEPALERSMRAVFAAVARHAIGSNPDADAKEVGGDLDWLTSASEQVYAAAIRRDDGLASIGHVAVLLAQLVESWHARSQSSKGLLWSDRARNLPQMEMLLAPRLPPLGGSSWPFDYSLRNVESSVSIPIGGSRRKRSQNVEGQ